MREIKTTLDNVLSHVCCAVDHGYYDDVLMCDFAALTGHVSDGEIEQFISENKHNQYTDEDYDTWRERMTEWRNKYCKEQK